MPDASGLWLVAARVFAILVVQPHWRAAIGGVWIPIAAALALLLAVPFAEPIAMPADRFLPALLAELVLGLVIGAFVALGGLALLGAAATGAIVLRVPPRPWMGLVVALVLASALQLGLHRPALLAVRTSLDLWPPGDPGAWAQISVARLVAAAHAMLQLALVLATPVLLAAAAVELALAVVGRGPGAASALAQALAPTARLAAVLVALGASWAIHREAWMPPLPPP